MANNASPIKPESAGQSPPENLSIQAGDLANASHELRTPLSALLMAIEMLRSTNLDQHQRMLLDTALHATTDMKRLVNDLVETTRVGHLSGGPNIERVDGYQLLSESINSLSALAREKAIGLEFWFDPKLPAHLRTDPGRLRQVINNLVGNAIKHIKRGTVTVSAYLTRLGEQGDALRLEIADTGPGIEEEKLRGLFSSSDASLESAIASQPTLGGPLSLAGKSQESSGLGLAITHKLVQQLKGELNVLSTVGSGTTVCVTLPLNVGSATDATASAGANYPARPPSGNACVLLVDDDRLSRVMLAALLEERGYRVIQAEDGEQALQEYCRESIDLVISDMCMPGISGAELARKIRVIEQLSNAATTPLVALTGMVDDTVTNNLLHDGFSETLTKPVLIDSLLHVLDSQLNPVASAPGEPAH